ANLQPGEKYVILAGAAHNNTHLGLNDGMPGFSQALGIPSVVVANVSGSYAMQLDREDVTKRTAATLLRPN
ncbi:MAG: hypothetical protein H7Y08_05110, partial [Rhizobiaceae bacterium]|nr:hypothetical protein [Rhizobiaceae bacterium]